jgi:hypothetical protein
METTRLIVVALVFLSFSGFSLADVGFTKEDLQLVKDACLAGTSFEFKTEADGSISVKNLQGKGKLSVSKKDVTTVDLPDSDKREEFKEIRSCIKDYLINKPNKKKTTSNFSRTCKYLSGPRAGETEYFPPEVPIIPARIGQRCTDGVSVGVAIADE